MLMLMLHHHHGYCFQLITCRGSRRHQDSDDSRGRPLSLWHGLSENVGVAGAVIQRDDRRLGTSEESIPSPIIHRPSHRKG
jgi:hypothetical protein